MLGYLAEKTNDNRIMVKANCGCGVFRIMGVYNTVEEVVNNSITQTLTRSIYTSLTTFVMVAVLYILGVSSVKEFALPLMVGILVGTYSSVCLASAFWYIFKKVFVKKSK